jgi:hypothetical protein
VSINFTLGVGQRSPLTQALCNATFRLDSPAGDCATMHCQTTARPPFQVGNYTLNCVTLVGSRLFFQLRRT